METREQTQTREDQMKPRNLDQLFEMMKNDEPSLPPWDALPTFGGPDIQHTALIWSWDVTRKIIGTGSFDIQIVDRDDIIATLR
jgi:hypothetical protein